MSDRTNIKVRVTKTWDYEKETSAAANREQCSLFNGEHGGTVNYSWFTGTFGVSWQKVKKDIDEKVWVLKIEDNDKIMKARNPTKVAAELLALRKKEIAKRMAQHKKAAEKK